MSNTPLVKLDRSKPYGEVHPPGFKGAHYQQGPFHFDAHGDLVHDMVDAHGQAELKRREIRAGAAAAAAKAEQEYLAKAGLAPEPKAAAPQPREPIEEAPPEPLTSNDDEPEDGIDLAGWLKGEKVYPFFKVTKAIRDTYGRSVMDKSTAKEFLIYDIKLVDQDDVKI